MEIFKKSGPIWSITLLHALQPLIYPIYDQHAHRAFSYLITGKISKMPLRYQAYNTYFEEYVKFFNDFSDMAKPYTRKAVDEALWSFGKFLSIYPQL